MSEYKIGDTARIERYFGVYATADSVPTFGFDPFDTQQWIITNEAYMQSMKLGMKQPGIPDIHFFPLIPLIMSKIQEKGYLRIVDIGGGNGENYINLARFFGTECMEYHVVEQRKNCKAGEKLQLPGNIFFHENQEVGSEFLCEDAVRLLKTADICMLVGTLQYFPMYSKLLREIAETGVEYIYITRTMLNSIVKTFFTRQYIAPDKGQYKDIIIGDTFVTVINHQELNQSMERLGYDICLDLFLMDYFKNVKNLPYDYNKVEYRNLLYQMRGLRFV